MPPSRLPEGRRRPRCAREAGGARAARGGSSRSPGRLGLSPAGSDVGGGDLRLQRRGPPTLRRARPSPRPSPHGHHHRPRPAASPSRSRQPAAHPSARVTVPRAPSRAGWGEGVTLITLGRERSGGESVEPLAAPPSPRVSLLERR